MDTWDKYYSYIKKWIRWIHGISIIVIKKMDPMDTWDKYYSYI
jgi:hypothetical protein